MRRIRFAGLVAVLMLGLALPAPVAANHTASCSDGGQTNRWKGNEARGAKHGAQAVLDSQTLNQCTSPGLFEISGSFAFVNVEADAFNDIVQIGVGVCRWPGLSCSSEMRVYWAWGRTSSSPGCSGYSSRGPTIDYIQMHDGHSHTYKVWHSANKWRVYIDGVEKKWVDESEICWTPTSASFFGESFDYGDSIGGESTNHYTFSGAKYANAEGGAFSSTSFASPCNYGAGAPVIYKCSVTSGTSFDIWTSR